MTTELQAMSALGDQVRELREEFRDHETSDQKRHDELVRLLTERAFGVVDRAQADAAAERKREADAEEEERKAKRDLRNKVITGLLALVTSLVTGALGYWMSGGSEAAPALQQTTVATEQPAPLPEP